MIYIMSKYMFVLLVVLRQVSCAYFKGNNKLYPSQFLFPYLFLLPC